MKSKTITNKRGIKLNKLNYMPNKKLPIVISKPSKEHKTYFIYEQDEIDPIISSKRFYTAEKALIWVNKYFPEHTIFIED